MVDDGTDRKFPRYIEGNYSANWAGIELPEGSNGLIVVARNKDGGGNTRIYAYADGTWSKTDLTEVQLA